MAAGNTTADIDFLVIGTYVDIDLIESCLKLKKYKFKTFNSCYFR